MHPKVYRATTAKEAFSRVSRELGADAVIISRRKVGTPDGRALVEVVASRREESASETKTAKPTAARNRRTRVLIMGSTVAALLLIASAALFTLPWNPSPPRNGRGDLEPDDQPSGAERQARAGEADALEAAKVSIAVLPFRDLSSEGDNEYFCDGVAEELITRLSKLRGVRVIASSSSFQFREEKVNHHELRRRLNVAFLLEGSVRKSGERIRITAGLTNVENSDNIWSENYEGENEDIFEIQDRIALAVVQELKVRLFAPEQPVFSKRHSTSAEAYACYLKGRYFSNMWAALGSFQKGIDYFRQACALDPNYAPAFAGMADCYMGIVFFAHPVPEDARLGARLAAQKAVALDGSFGEAHTALGMVEFYLDWDLCGAEESYINGVEYSPGSAFTHREYFWYLSYMLRAEEALDHARKAYAIDPLSPSASITLAIAHWSLDHTEEAMSLLEETIAMWPTCKSAFTHLSYLYLELGMPLQAEAAFTKWKSLAAPNDVNDTLKTAIFYCLKQGRTEESLSMLHTLLTRIDIGQANPVLVARVYDALGDIDEAMKILEKGYEQRYPYMVSLRSVELTDALKNDPRFMDLLARIGFRR